MGTNDIFTQATEYAFKLFNLAPAPFTVLIVLAVGYALRLVKRFPNEWIPVACLVTGTLLFPALLFPALDTKPVGWAEGLAFLVRSLSTGLVLGLATWLIHDKLISQIEDKIPFLGKLLKAATPSAPENPPADKPPGQSTPPNPV